MKFDKSEITILALIAEQPNNPKNNEAIEKLTGEAKLIAEFLALKRRISEATDEQLYLVDSIRIWVSQKNG